MENKNDVYDKWNSFGFLEGVSEKKKIETAKAFEYVSNKLLDDSISFVRIFNSNVDVDVFAILRAISKRCESIELTERFLDDLLLKVLELTESSVYDGIDDIHGTFEDGKDGKAILLNMFIEKNYE